MLNNVFQLYNSFNFFKDYEKLFTDSETLIYEKLKSFNKSFIEPEKKGEKKYYQQFCNTNNASNLFGIWLRYSPKNRPCFDNIFYGFDFGLINADFYNNKNPLDYFFSLCFADGFIDEKKLDDKKIDYYKYTDNENKNWYYLKIDKSILYKNDKEILANKISNLLNKLLNLK